MKCPLPRYYLCHAVIGLLIALAVTLVLWWPLGLLVALAVGFGTGAGFYAGREFTQWEQGGGAGLPFDWRGLLAPVLLNGALILAIILITAL